jgi:hypothetical protein
MRELKNGMDFDDPHGIRTTRIPVDLSTGTQVKIRYFSLPVEAGDYLEIEAELDVTNDTGRGPGETRINVGMGWMLWYYDANAPAAERPGTWKQIGTSRGMNVLPAVHHLAVDIERDLDVPADWPPGHQMGIALMADAHSTAWNVNGGGEALTVEPYGRLQVTRYRNDPEVPAP